MIKCYFTIWALVMYASVSAQSIHQDSVGVNEVIAYRKSIGCYCSFTSKTMFLLDSMDVLIKEFQKLRAKKCDGNIYKSGDFIRITELLSKRLSGYPVIVILEIFGQPDKIIDDKYYFTFQNGHSRLILKIKRNKVCKAKWETIFC